MICKPQIQAKLRCPPDLTDPASPLAAGTDFQGPVRWRFLRHRTLDTGPWNDQSKLRCPN
jgi:hypothetical protein